MMNTTKEAVTCDLFVGESSIMLQTHNCWVAALHTDMMIKCKDLFPLL